MAIRLRFFVDTSLYVSPFVGFAGAEQCPRFDFQTNSVWFGTKGWQFSVAAKTARSSGSGRVSVSISGSGPETSARRMARFIMSRVRCKRSSDKSALLACKLRIYSPWMFADQCGSNRTAIAHSMRNRAAGRDTEHRHLKSPGVCPNLISHVEFLRLADHLVQDRLLA